MRRFQLILLLVLSLSAPALAAPLCAACGGEVKGSYVEALGKLYHPDHFRCGACKGPIDGRFAHKNGVPYHRECYVARFSPRCEICQKPIEGSYMQDYWGNRFHPEHRAHYPFCSTCSRPITQKSSGGYKLQDGRIVCGLCRSQGVFKQAEADKLAEEAREILEGWGLRIPQKKISIILVDKQQLARDGYENATGLIRNQTRGEERTIRSIHMLYGVPRPMFLGTLVHELTHGWIFLTLPPIKRALAWEEGFCNYISYLYYRTQGVSSADYFIRCLELDPNPVYGDGFRRVRAIAERQGSRALVPLLKTANDFPPGY